MQSLLDPIVIQRVQTRRVVPSPHARMCEGYFSSTSASGGLTIMAVNASAQSFSGC